MNFIDPKESYYIPSDKMEFWFNKNGEEISSENEKFYAKIIEKNNSRAYYIRTYDGAIYDPLGMFSRRESLDIVMTKVSKSTFDFYMMYLRTNNNIFLTRAERGFLNV